MKILEKAKMLFSSHGVKSISMDELAKHAGVSKKTIYQCYTDKTELIEKTVEDLIVGQKLLFGKCERAAADAIEELFLKTNASFEVWGTTTPSFFLQLERSYPTAWKQLQYYQQDEWMPGLVDNMHRGMIAGLYRNNLDVVFAANVFLLQQMNVLQTNSFNHSGRSSARLLLELSIFFLHAICTPQGKIKLEKYINKYDETKQQNTLSVTNQ